MEPAEFGNADPHERTLWTCACLAWTMALRDSYRPAGESSDGRVTYYDIDLTACPAVEICDERYVRLFTVRQGSGESVEFALSDPIREANPKTDEMLLDHAVIVYPNGKRHRLQVREHLPERILNLTAYVLPRRNREAMIGDIFEDLHELRLARRKELYIISVIIWQLLLAIGSEWIAAILKFLLRLLLIQQLRDALRHWFAR